MSSSTIHFHPSGKILALVGNPNCGKTALFNLLSGGRQKVANYAGVTVERKEGRVTTPAGKSFRLIDLPGANSLHPRSPDEKVTIDVLQGKAMGEKRPDLVMCVVDATKLRRNLRLVLAVKRQGLPCVLVVNMADLARQRGIPLDVAALGKALDMPAVESVAIKRGGAQQLLQLLDTETIWNTPNMTQTNTPISAPETGADHEQISALLRSLGLDQIIPHPPSEWIDRTVLHPAIGPAILLVTLFLIFQAVFSWSEAPMTLIKTFFGDLGAWIGNEITVFFGNGLLKSFVVEGLIAGLGGVIVFLPQILILFFFILLLEESGYLPRAAYLLDHLMGSVGLSGRSFIPLLSSFACAIPGVMATRTISNVRDRHLTMLLAPLMTCSARLPVYALLIGAFIPKQSVWGGVELQGLVLFSLYLAGIFSAMAVAWLIKILTRAGAVSRPLMMELPEYHLPSLRNLALGLWQRALIFMKRVGGIILTLTIILWFLSTFPTPPEGATGAAIEYSFAGQIGHLLALVFAPIGFNWQISVALIPGMAAREVMVSALGTVYAVSTEASNIGALGSLLVQTWSTATAYALLAWFVFAPQCLATIAAIKRESNGWRLPLIALGYLFTLAYLAAFATYQIAIWALS